MEDTSHDKHLVSLHVQSVEKCTITGKKSVIVKSLSQKTRRTQFFLFAVAHTPSESHASLRLCANIAMIVREC